jgi:hypothetical protein
MLMPVEAKISPQRRRERREVIFHLAVRGRQMKSALWSARTTILSNTVHGQRKANLILFPEGSGL